MEYWIHDLSEDEIKASMNEIAYCIMRLSFPKMKLVHSGTLA